MTVVKVRIIRSTDSLRRRRFACRVGQRRLRVGRIVLSCTRGIRNSFIRVKSNLFFVCAAQNRVRVRFRRTSVCSLVRRTGVRDGLGIEVNINCKLATCSTRRGIQLTLRCTQSRGTSPIIDISRAGRVGRRLSRYNRRTISCRRHV